MSERDLENFFTPQDFQCEVVAFGEELEPYTPEIRDALARHCNGLLRNWAKAQVVGVTEISLLNSEGDVREVE